MDDFDNFAPWLITNKLHSKQETLNSTVIFAVFLYLMDEVYAHGGIEEFLA